MSHAHIDFETQSEAELTKVGADFYSQHHTTKIMCMAYAFDNEPIQLWHPGLPPPQRLLDHVKAGGKVLGHNIGGFEMLLWNNVAVFEFGWPELKIEQCECTMAMAYAMGLPGSLDDAARAAGIPYQKDKAGYRIMLKLCKPKGFNALGEPFFWTPEDVPQDFEALYIYCKQDVEVERGLLQRLLHLSPYEQKVWELDYKINRRGVYVDMMAARVAAGLVEVEKKRMDKKIREVTGNAVAMTTAVGQLSDWLKSRGIEVPSLAKADVTELLTRDLPEDCRAALLLRKEAAKTSTSKLTSMTIGASAGNRSRGLFQYSGASTRRWAGRRVQLQNLPRPTIKQDQIDKIFELLNRYGASAGPYIREMGLLPMSALSDCIRGFLRAAPGNDLIACDFSAIEARVVAWLAGQESTLKVFRGDGKIYELTAAGIYGVKPEEINKDDPRRQVGKVAMLSLGFEGGVGALQAMSRGYNVKLEPAFDLLRARATEDHMRKAEFVFNLNYKSKYEDKITPKEFVASDLVKQFWREANPMIVDYWEKINEAAIMAVKNPGHVFGPGAHLPRIAFRVNGSFLWCQLPSGGVICYPYPKVEMKAAFKDSEPKPTLTCMGVNSVTKSWERYHCYGGFLTENVTQSVARDLLVEAMFRLEAKGYPIVMHIHDEIVNEVKKGFGSLEEVEHIVSQNPAWAMDLPIAAEGWRGERFRK